MKKSKGIISLILTVVLIALLGFTTVVGFGKGQTGAAKNISELWTGYLRTLCACKKYG